MAHGLQLAVLALALIPFSFVQPEAAEPAKDRQAQSQAAQAGALPDVLLKPVATQALKNITAVHVRLRDLPVAAAKCNLNYERLRLAAVRPLLDGGIKVLDQSNASSQGLEIEVLVVQPNESLCAAFISVAMRQFTFFLPIHQQELPRGLLGLFLGSRGEPNIKTVLASIDTVTLNQDGTLLTGSPVDFGDRVEDATRRIVDELVTEIKLANQ